jgi:hypothetical protein
MKEATRPLWHPRQPDWVAIPDNIAVCPECGDDLVADAQSWQMSDGRPVTYGLIIECVSEDFPSLRPKHRNRQSDWQPVRDAVAKWCGAVAAGVTT